MSRRDFLAVSGGALAAPVLGVSAAVGQPESFPVHNWSRVPSAIDIGKIAGNFSASESQFLASKFSLVAIEKDQATRLQPEGQKETETGVFAAADALKQSNPSVKVLFYWSATTFHPEYAAAKRFDPSWALPQKPGEKRILFDRGNPQVRDWWTESAAGVVAHANVDGVFLDSVNNRTADPLTRTMLEELRAKLNAVKPNALIVYNGVLHAPSDPAMCFDIVDGMMYEHFAYFQNAEPDKIRDDIQTIRDIGRAGKIVIVKGWPGFSLVDPMVKTTPYRDLVAMARRNITFPLAAFLCAANRFSFFQYGWGYSPDGGSYVLEDDKETIDPSWYPELLHPIGTPRGDASLNDYTFVRSFEHADVTVNVQTKAASIDWR